MTNFTQIFLESVKLILAGMIGGLIGATTNDKLTRKREKENGIAARKRNFLAFMAQLRAETANVHNANWGDFLAAKIPNIQHSVALIEKDLASEILGQLDSLVSSVCGLPQEQIYNAHNREKIAKTFGEIVVLVKNSEEEKPL